MKTKTGEEISGKEFLSRWRKGIERVTPLQQIIFSLLGNLLVVVGVAVGLYVTYKTKIWWLFIILSGSMFLSAVGLLGNIQKYIALDRIAKQIKQFECKEVENGLSK